MRYLLSYCTDAGIAKKINQDSLLIQRGFWRGKQIALAVLCDGMGGLEKGEIASASVIRQFAGWFRQKLPLLLKRRGKRLEDGVLSSWSDLLKEEDKKISEYGRKHGIELGTTVTAMLFVGKVYYIAHVGDSRAYELTGEIRQLTRDQTLAEWELCQGRLTRQEAEQDSRRNVLLQSIGAGGGSCPAYIRGTVCEGAVYLLCSDGFRHEVSAKELLQAFCPSEMTGEDALREACFRMTELNKERDETDNISVIAIRTAAQFFSVSSERTREQRC